MSYNVKLGLCLIGLSVSILGTSALAQESASVGFAACKVWAKEDSSPSASELANTFECLAKKIDQLETELRPFKSVRGAVIAFDRDRTVDQVCPPGWTYFNPTGGRFIVGAGEHTNTGLREYPSYVEDNTQAIGGEQEHVLLEEEMPSHDHQQVWGQGGGTLGAAHGESVRDFPGKAVPQSTLKKGGGKAHNNMPPYVALYFCKKD
jgi:hypothetical protein